jgi:hypothetical protein
MQKNAGAGNFAEKTKFLFIRPGEGRSRLGEAMNLMIRPGEGRSRLGESLKKIGSLGRARIRLGEPEKLKFYIFDYF